MFVKVIFKNKREREVQEQFSGLLSIEHRIVRAGLLFQPCVSSSEITITTISTVVAGTTMGFTKYLLCAWPSARHYKYIIFSPHTSTSRMVLLSPLYK